MQKWEYLRLIVHYDHKGDITSAWTIQDTVFDGTGRFSYEDLQTYLDKCGSEGWELVSAGRLLNDLASMESYYFKRPVN